MDLNLVTGQPGSSKTLNTIKMVEERRLKEVRPVYYINIDDLTLDGWIKMDEPDALLDNPEAITPHSWFNAPEGAIIVIDECQDYFPKINSSSKQPDYIMRMAKFRHFGYSMYLITQGPNLINTNIKEWVQPHIHIRRLWGGKSAYHYINESCIDNVRSSKISKNAIIKKVKFDKSYFGKYKSAVQHNTSKRVNKKLVAFTVIPLILLPIALSFFYSWWSSLDKSSQPQSTVSAQQQGQAINQVLTEAIEPTLDPYVAYTPRIDNVPESAPVYDKLRLAVKTFPKPSCIMSVGRCICYTQQATLMKDYPDDLCRQYVIQGRFDATKPDKVNVRGASRARSRERSIASVSERENAPSQFYYPKYIKPETKHFTTHWEREIWGEADKAP